MKQFPETLQTARLNLRVAMPRDGQVVNQAVIESLPELETWVPWVHPVPTVEASETTCRNAFAKYLLNQELMLLMFLRDTGDFCGCVGLHKVDWTLRHFETGYWARTRHSGQGLVTEAVRALSDFALEQMDAARVSLTTDPRNTKSCRVAELAGFELEGRLRNERLDQRGLYRDTLVFSRIGCT